LLNCAALKAGCSDPYVVEGVPPFPNAYNGHFIHMTVVSVAPRR
jgi:hypothetical protein